MPADIGQKALDQYFEDIVNIAPAEGNSPFRMLSDQTNEAKCFPVLFPVGEKTFHYSWQHHLTVTALALTALCQGLKTRKSSPQTKQSPAKTMSYFGKMR